MNNDDLEKIYRPSSTLIIVAKDSSTEQGYNYRVTALSYCTCATSILLAKRTASIAFAPDHYVFPGGVCDQRADENAEWLKYFETFGICNEDLKKLCLSHLPNRPIPLMTNGANFSRDISLRITAIREAFEEVGLFLCINHNELKSKKKCSGSFLQNFNRSYWQHKVHNNAMEFLYLCKHMDVVPDLWSLQEWSIWRSPPTSRKKYDTVIYVVTLATQPTLLLEPTEVEQELWSTPSASLQMFKNCLIWLAPMQFYEISRLCNIFDWSELQAFVKSRNSKGSTLLMLAYFKCTDYLVGVLPGDDYYPANTLNHSETNQLSITNTEFIEKTKNIHRLIYYDFYNLHVTLNITPLDGHLSPALDSLGNNSKL